MIGGMTVLFMPTPLGENEYLVIENGQNLSEAKVWGSVHVTVQGAKNIMKNRPTENTLIWNRNDPEIVRTYDLGKIGQRYMGLTTEGE